MSLAARLHLAHPPGQPVDHRPVILLEGDAAEIEAAWPMFDAALRHSPAYRLVIAVPREDVVLVQRRFSHERVVEHSSHVPAALTIRANETAERIAKRLEALPHAPVTRTPIAAMVARAILPLTGAPRFETADALCAALGRPAQILCLGNGPSSRKARADDHRDATLFRVNWIWRKDASFNRPRMVFTADPDVPPHGLDAILGFPDSTCGFTILAHHLLAGRRPRAGYIFADHLLPPLTTKAEPLRPTNGAIMIATAAALQPKKLIIGGIDLYRHSEGRYPESPAMDGYARGHSADCDLAVIRHALLDFPGEIEHLNPEFAAALAAISDRSPAFPPSPSRHG
ncbi:hypothetical protein [Aestuariivirga sp.]|uniref:hypothetical protein n=1 Tax=Aestuariivirga sp. TaxID=2650926 RepID=UPI0039E33895